MPISPVISPATVTFARFTRWMTARIAGSVQLLPELWQVPCSLALVARPFYWKHADSAFGLTYWPCTKVPMEREERTLPVKQNGLCSCEPDTFLAARVYHRDSIGIATRNK